MTGLDAQGPGAANDVKPSNGTRGGVGGAANGTNGADSQPFLSASLSASLAHSLAPPEACGSPGSSINGSRQGGSIARASELSTPVVIDDDGNVQVFIGGRKSRLALVQSQIVAEGLKNAHPGLSFPVQAISTLGDKVLTQPLYSFGGKALWTKELETLLLNKVPGYDQLDMVVHSLKDMPTVLPEGCELGAITEREDARDAILFARSGYLDGMATLSQNNLLPPPKYKSLEELPDGSIVGTSSIRRIALLQRKYPGLKFRSIRGNIQTRIKKLDATDSEFDCIVLAAAGLVRTGLESRIDAYMDGDDMYYAVGQGALGIEIRANDTQIRRLLLEAVHHVPTALRCYAERALMRELEGGCSVPLGVRSEYNAETQVLTLQGIVISVDGSESAESFEVCKGVTTAAEAELVGTRLADKLIAKGAKRILDNIRMDQS